MQCQSPFKDHFFHFDLFGRDALELVGKRVPHDVSGKNTEQGRDESRGDGVAEHVNIGKVAQSGNQADNGTENAQRRRIHTSLCENGGAGTMTFFHLLDF